MIIAHEIGHTFGARNEGGKSECKVREPTLGYGNIMTYAGANNILWSSCSRKRFRDYYVQKKNNWCMEEKPDTCCYREDMNGKSFQHLGCFAEDPLNPSLPILLGKKVSSRYTAQECFELAGLLGHPIFGIRDYECYAAPTNTTYDSKGTSTSCNCERGALNSVSAFKVDFSKPVLDFEDLGCWADKYSPRALPIMLKYEPYKGVTKDQCFQAVKDENEKRRADGEAPYTVFSVQDLRECRVSEDTESYKRYGESDKCWNGQGGAWANSVYRLTVN